MVSGIAPIKGGESTRMQIQNTRPKVLCTRHNNCLTALDSLAKRFFSFLFEQAPHPRFLLINGDDLERWFLKVLCGYVSAGFLLDETGTQLNGWTPPKHWLEILFGDEVIPRGCGLCIPSDGTWETRSGFLKIQPHFFNGPPKAIAWMEFLLDHFRFVFTMRPLPSDSQLQRRPSILQISSQGLNREIHFGWRTDVIVGLAIDLHNNRPTPESPSRVTRPA
jgi:hypothetical protein